MVCAAHCVREAQTTPMYALRVKPMLGGRLRRPKEIKKNNFGKSKSASLNFIKEN